RRHTRCLSDWSSDVCSSDLAPGAQALLRDKAQFGDVVLGPLSDFVRTDRRDAQLAEQLLGEWLHAVLVRDDAAVEAVRQWHERTRPGPLVLLPCAPGPRRTADGHPLADELRVDGPAAAWVRALLAGHEVLDGGRALRRANGAVVLTGAAAGGPLEGRAELERHEVERVRLDERLGAERARLVELEAQQEAAREQRVRWQVETAQGEAHLAAARARAERAAADAAEARRQGASLADEMATIDRELAAQTAQQGEWTDTLQE